MSKKSIKFSREALEQLGIPQELWYKVEEQPFVPTIEFQKELIKNRTQHKVLKGISVDIKISDDFSEFNSPAD